MTEEAGCERCGFALWLPIMPLGVSRLGLYDDRRYPGRCLLVLNDHYEDLAEMPDPLAFGLLADARTAAMALRDAAGAARVNYAVLGNAEPHVHFHLIPRGGPDDPAPGRSPWDTATRATALEPERRSELIDAIRRNLLNRLHDIARGESTPTGKDDMSSRHSIYRSPSHRR